MAAPRTTAPRGSTGGNTWASSIDIGGSMQFLWPGQAIPASHKDYFITIYYDPSEEDIAAGFQGRQFVQIGVDTTWTRQQIDTGLQNAMIRRREQNNPTNWGQPPTGRPSPKRRRR